MYFDLRLSNMIIIYKTLKQFYAQEILKFFRAKKQYGGGDGSNFSPLPENLTTNKVQRQIN